MSNNQLATVDPVALALKQIERSLPEKFTFSISTYYLRGLDFAVGIERAQMLRKFEDTCIDLGYNISHSFDSKNDEWIYVLKKEAIDL